MSEREYLRQLLRQARPWVDRAAPRGEDQTSDVCLLLQEIDDATAEHAENCGIYNDGQCTCPRPPQPQDTARCSYATPAATQIVYLEKRKAELEAEVERLKADLEMVDSDLQLAVKRLTAEVEKREGSWQRGAAAMREAAAQVLDAEYNAWGGGGNAAALCWRMATAIRALPIPENK